MAVTVTVGRNVNGSPMDTAGWQNFNAEVLIAVRAFVGEPYFTGTGVGHSERWGDEDAFTVIAEEPQYSDVREKLDAELARVGRFYGQEAVAVTEGTTRFV
jgi:hypothetical protein